jgi:hypothetical protein
LHEPFTIFLNEETGICAIGGHGQSIDDEEPNNAMYLTVKACGLSRK